MREQLCCVAVLKRRYFEVGMREMYFVVVLKGICSEIVTGGRLFEVLVG